MGLRILITLALLSASLHTLKAQNFKKELTPSEIESFKEQAEFYFELYSQSVINILNENLTLRQRLNSRNVLRDLFSNQSSLITDYLADPLPVTLPVNEYAVALFELQKELPLIDKSYKFSDSIYVESTTRSFRSVYKDLPHEERYKKEFQVYKGRIFFLEKLVNSRVVDSEYFSFIRRNELRYINFRIMHNSRDKYELKFERIGFVDDENILYDYKSIVNEVQNSSRLWSIKEQELHLANLREKAIKIGLHPVASKIDSVSKSKEIDIVAVTDSSVFKLEKLKFHQYIVPGLGHLASGEKRSRKLRAGIYGGLFLGTSGMAIYNRIWHHKHIARSNETMVLSRMNELLDRADQSKKYSNYYLAGVGAVILANIIHLSVQENNKKRMAAEAGYRPVGLNNIMIDMAPTLTLNIQLGNRNIERR